MKQLTVCIDDGLQGEVVYRAEISHTEEDYKELKSDLEFVREENKKLKEDMKTLESAIEDLVRENRRLKEQRIFSSAEYDLITLTSTTPQWELRPRDENWFYKEAKTNLFYYVHTDPKDPAEFGKIDVLFRSDVDNKQNINVFRGNDLTGGYTSLPKSNKPDLKFQFKPKFPA